MTNPIPDFLSYGYSVLLLKMEYASIGHLAEEILNNFDSSSSSMYNFDKSFSSSSILITVVLTDENFSNPQISELIGTFISSWRRGTLTMKFPATKPG